MWRTGKFSWLGASASGEMRIMWRDVTTIVIDEISMVSYQMLVQIHLRVNEIFAVFDKNVYFGRLNSGQRMDWTSNYRKY